MNNVDIAYKMNLTADELAILNGSEGQTKAKVMKTIVMFGETFGAKRLVPINHPIHLVTSFGIGILKPMYRIMDELIAAGLQTKEGFTVDPRPIDYENVKCNLLEKIVFSKVMYNKQADYEVQLQKVGLKDENAFTCACYLNEVGNTPKKGDILSWAESSAVVYANSVLGARCNRNSGVLELFGGIIGKVPEFGLLTDDGRMANWIIEIKTSKMPEAQILGSAIGMKVMEDVPYIVGLDRFIGNEINSTTIAYLKDMGAATASNGAVGLYHVDNLTPEAKQAGRSLIRENAKTYIIDDAELNRIYKAYPVMWKDKAARPKLCFIGCPHLTLDQLINWTKDITTALQQSGKTKVALRTVMTAAPDVMHVFKNLPQYKTLLATGVKLSSICPLMYMNNPIANKKPVITNSNKLRTYTTSRYQTDKEILNILSGKEVQP